MKKMLAVVTTALLAIGLAAVGVASPASAHTPSISTSCSALTVDLKDYAKQSGGRDAVYKDWNETVVDSAAVPESVTTVEEKVAPTDTATAAETAAPAETEAPAEKKTIVTPAVAARTHVVNHHDLVAAAVAGKTNTIKVTIDGALVLDTTFGSTFSQVFPFSDNTSAHSYTVKVVAWDDHKYDVNTSGKSTPCAPPSHPKCVTSPEFSYTYDAATSSGSVTVTGGKKGKELCSPLYLRAATWDYDLPTNGNSPSWSQTLNSYQDVKIDSIGTFAFAAPNQKNCQQHDIYATFSPKGFAALTLPTQLFGPQSPWEPPFLHDTLKGMGPKPTYDTDSSKGCTVIDPKVVLVHGDCVYQDGNSYTPLTLTYDNTGSNVPVTFTVDDTDGSYDRTVAAGASVVITDLPRMMYPSSGGYTVHAGDQVFDLPTHSSDCTPTVPEPTDPTSHDQLCVDGSLVSGSITVDTAAEHVSYRIEGTTTDGTPVVIDPVTTATTALEPGTYTVTATADAGFAFPGGHTTRTWPASTITAASDCGQLPTDATVIPTLSSSQPTCDAAGSYTLDDIVVEGVRAVNWTVDGVPTDPGTYSVPAGRTVQVHAATTSPQFGFDVDTQVDWTLNFAARGDCGQLTTLAFTGVDGSSGGLMLTGLLMLLAGAGIYAAGRMKVRRS